MRSVRGVVGIVVIKVGGDEGGGVRGGGGTRKVLLPGSESLVERRGEIIKRVE
jgi:hypothetical protein